MAERNIEYRQALKCARDHRVFIMAESTQWAFPLEAQPSQADVAFDLRSALDAVVLLSSEVPEDAFTASILGTERVGNGVVIREDGLILTIGYLVTEAEKIWVTLNDGTVVPGHALAYDQASGFGLVQPLGRLKARWLARGSAAAAKKGDDVIVIGSGGRVHALKARIIDKREFAGYWEYVLDEALFTAPPHPQWGGAALVGADGRLLGIGSLLVQEQHGGESISGNMFVPIDLLEPVFDDMLKFGRPARPPRPWLGMYTGEAEQRLAVTGLATGGPADSGGVKLGDMVLEVGGERVTGLADMFRKIWRLGQAGVEVPLTVTRDAQVLHLQLRSGDRNDYLKKPPLQ
jgi:S1-C subfamily serine protease